MEWCYATVYRGETVYRTRKIVPLEKALIASTRIENMGYANVYIRTVGGSRSKCFITFQPNDQDENRWQKLKDAIQLPSVSRAYKEGEAYKIEEGENKTYSVFGSTGNEYFVTWDGLYNVWRCNCPHYLTRCWKVCLDCKHIVEIKFRNRGK